MTSCYLCESHQDNPAKTTNRFPGGSTSLTLHCIQSYLNISFAWFYFLIPLFYSWVFALPANRNCFLFGIDCVRSWRLYCCHFDHMDHTKTHALSFPGWQATEIVVPTAFWPQTSTSCCLFISASALICLFPPVTSKLINVVLIWPWLFISFSIRHSPEFNSREAF